MTMTRTSRCCILLYFYFISALGYNLDTNFPILYEDPSPNGSGRSSYFGYSVLLSGSWIQIGAPRANFSTHEMNIEPGVAYHCKFNKSCVQLSLGKTHSKNHFSISDSSWFGVAMDFERGGMGNIVVCGHRWMNASISKTLVIPGACYSFQPDQDLNNITNILTPTASVERDKIYFLQETSGKIVAFKYALSQSGISVHFSNINKTSNSLLLGAPGFLNWKGTVVKCDNLAQCTKKPSVIDTYQNTKINEFDLFGYQVSSGHFFSRKELLFVAGAPRDPTMKGYIMIYKLTKDNSKLETILKVHGMTTGEYFGSSIAVGDINNDGLDELIVGAPFFTQNGDEGRIYILEFHKDGSLKKMEHVEGQKENGRFGTAVANIGDLDLDGFADIAVGAPYEGNGVVYIYYGRSSGLKESYQRVPAEDIHKSLRGFGCSFSGQADIDENDYNDVAVGSFLSGHAVILRSLPVVTLNAFIKPLTRQLSTTTKSEADIQVCVHYSGTNVPKLNVTLKISADRSYGRAKPSFIQDTVMLNISKEEGVCKKYKFSVKLNLDLTQQSMEFLLSVHVTNTSNSSIRKQYLLVQEDGLKSGVDGFYDQDPVQRMFGGHSEDQLNIPFSQDCKSDVCQPDLQLECFLLENKKKFILSQPFIIGSMAEYQLQIDVTNSGEPSYTTSVEIRFSKEIRLASMPFKCNEIKNTIICQLGRIGNHSEVETTTLNLDMSSVEELNIIDDQILHINVSVNTTGTDSNIKNNVKQLVLHLSLDVEAHLYGKSQKDNYPISKLENGSFASVVETVQTYEVHKKGTSPLKMFELKLEVPVNITSKQGETQVLSYYKPDGIIDSKYWYCSADFGCLDCQSSSPRGIESSEISTSESIGKKTFYENLKTIKDKAPPSNRTFYINCTSENVKCATIRCQTTELKAYGKVTLRMIVNVEKLGPLMGRRDIIYVTTTGEIEIINPDVSSIKKNIQQEWPHIAEASSQIIGKIPKKEVDKWVIVASAIGGILLAMFVSMGLAKAGFFQRQVKADLEELKEKTRHSQIQPQPMNNMAVEFDTDMELN